jgi:hypothetical protein
MGAVAAIAKSVTSKPKAPPPPPAPAPTQAEVSQATATEEQGLTSAQRARRRGRSATILTSTMGVEGETTLGKKSLLGG